MKEGLPDLPSSQRKKSSGKLVFENTDIDAPVRLFQNSTNRFTVEYGMCVKSKLTYDQAATELGACLMHALACKQRLKLD